MSLFHQIRRADEMDRLQRQQERAFNSMKAADKGAKALQAATGRGRKPDPNAKKLLTLRLDPDVIEHFKATGEGWQTRMNDALRKAAGL